MAHETVIRSSLLVRDVQNPNTTVQKFAVFTGSGNNSLNLMGFRTANELLTDLGFNEAVDDRVSTLLQAGANISLNYDDNGNTLTIAAPNTVTGSGTATQIAFWGGTTGTTSTALSANSNLYWDNINNRLGLGTSNPSATYHQSQTQGIFARYDITNANADQNRGVWEFYTNTAITPDFFGRFGFKFEGGVNNPAKHFQLHVNDATNPRLIVNGNGNVGISTIAPSARLHVVSSNNSNSTWTAQFHNSLGNNNALMIRDDGNVGIGTTGTTARLVVRGSGDTANTNALLIQNSGTNTLFQILDNGDLRLGNLGNSAPRIYTVDTNGNQTIDGHLVFFNGRITNQNLTDFGIYNFGGSNLNGVTGTQNTFVIRHTFNPPSGSTIYNSFRINTTINQIGGASGITRGLFISPILTTAADWRSIEWNNINGFGLYGSGTAPNYLAGNLSIGTITAAQTLHIAGTMRLTGSTGTGTTLMARDANGDVSAVTVGSGLSLSNNSIAISTSGTNIVTGSGTATQVAFWGGTNTLSGNSNLYWDNTNNRLGVGITNPTSNLDVVGTVEFQNPTTDYDGGVLGSELLSTGTGTGWTGSTFVGGYTHVTGNTAALVSSFTPANATIYQLIYTISGRTAGSISFTFGGYSSGTLSSNVTGVNVSQATTGTGALTVTPTSDFNGTVIFSVKAIAAGSAGFVAKNQAGTIVYEERYSSSNSNVFQGVNAGSRNTTGQGNVFQGFQAGFRNTTGFNNIFQGNNAGPTNTTGSSNFFQGSNSGNSNTTGSNNFFQGVNAGYSNTSGSNNIYKGVNAGFSATTGGNNIAIGFQAARFFGSGSDANTIFNNSIFLGYQTRALADNQTNQIVIGYNVVGLGSNTTVIGNTGTTQTHLHGNLTLGLTNTPNARMVVTGSGNSDSGWTAQFHNNTGSNNALMIRDDGKIGIRTASPTNTLHVLSLLGNSAIATFSGANNDRGLVIGTFLTNTTDAGVYFNAQTATGPQLDFQINGTSAIRVHNNRNVAIGNTNPNVTAQLDVDSTTRGFLPPRLTTSQRNLITTPATGLQIYNTTDNVMQHYNGTSWVNEAGGGGVGTVTGSGAATQVAFWTGSTGSTTELAGNSNLYWDNSSNSLGIGITTPTSNLDVVGTVEFQNPTAAYDGGILGSELLTASGWTTTGWTGTYASGFTHTTGNTSVLSNTLAATIGWYYQIEYTITGRTAGSITISFGEQSLATITTSGTFGPLATSTANLQITPTSDFNGTVVLSVKRITAGDPIFVGKNQAGTNVYEERYHDASNLFNGLSAGRYNTTGQNNTFVGAGAGGSNTTGLNNTFIGRDAGRVNTTASYNLFMGFGAGYSNTTGTQNVFLGSGAGYSNTTGSNNMFQGRNTGYNNTTGTGNVFQGTTTGNSNTTGSNNTFQGGLAGRLNTTGNNNVFTGFLAGQSNIVGSNNIAIGVDASRLINSGAANNNLDNSIFIGYQTRAANVDQTNQIVIGYLGRGLGSNTTVIGNDSTTQTHLHGNLTLGLTNTPNARMVVTGSGNSNTTWTAQFHNNTGTNNALMIRDDGRVGVNTTTMTGLFNIANTGITDPRIWIQAPTNTEDANTLIDAKRPNGGNIFRFTDQGRFEIGNGVGFYPSAGGTTSAISRAAAGIFVGESDAANNTSTTPYVTFGKPHAYARTTTGVDGVSTGVQFIGRFEPASTNINTIVFRFTPTYNQTGTANGNFIGIDYNPTVTSILGKHYAALFRSGLVGIGTATPEQTLHVVGTMRLTASTGTGTTLMARNGAGDVSAVSVGGGLSLSNNILSATGGGSGSVSGSGTATQIAFWDGLSSITGSANLYWDQTTNALERSNGNFSSTGDAQTSDFRLRNIATGGTQVELYLDGVSAKAILSGTNKLWNAKIQVAAIISSAGSGEVVDGDSWVSEHMIGIKKIGSTTSIVGGGVTQNLIAADTSMEGCIVTINADDTNEALRVLFTPSLSVASNTQTRIVATVYLTEVGF
jgi:hypothetical protein